MKLNPIDLRTVKLPTHKQDAVWKMIARVLECTQSEVTRIFVAALGNRVTRELAYGDLYDLGSLNVLEVALKRLDIDRSTILIHRICDMLLCVTDAMEPCENPDCAELPIYEFGGAVRASKTGDACLYCKHEPEHADSTRQHPTSTNTEKRVVAGEYEVERFIAEGAIGRTYVATDLTVGKLVCLKNCYKLNPGKQENLLEEARKMWDLRHHSIPAIRRVVKLENGTYAVVMSYIPGDTIEEIVKREGRIHPEGVAWILERVLNPLWYLHVRGIIHGDLKPQNILVDETLYSVAIVDFGLALVKPDEHSHAIGFTDYFAPPEQVQGGSPIPETDHYALGKVALYMLNGGDLRAVKDNQIPDGIPPLLSDFILKLVVDRVMERPQHADRLFNEITRLRKQLFKREWFAQGEKPLQGDSHV